MIVTSSAAAIVGPAVRYQTPCGSSAAMTWMAYAASARFPATSSRPSCTMISRPTGPSSRLEHEDDVAGEFMADLVQGSGGS